MNGTELLLQLFESVPDPDEVVGKNNGRIGGAIKDPEGPVAVPLKWLTAYGIPIIETQACDMPAGALALFYPSPPRVVIPYYREITPEIMWHVWHETGHAADMYHREEDGALRAYPFGRLSTKHRVMLQMHQSIIIQWHPHPDIIYKTDPKELWAEALAAMVMAPERVPEQLQRIIRPDLELLGIPLRAEEKKLQASWSMEVFVDGKWTSNGLRFATEAESITAGKELLSRWYVPTNSRAVLTEDPVNAHLVNGRGCLIQ